MFRAIAFAATLTLAPLAAAAQAPADPLAVKVDPEAERQATALRDEGEALYLRGESQAAQVKFNAAYEIASPRLGIAHPLTLDLSASLAVTFGDLGDRKSEEELERTLLEINRLVGGPDAPATLLVLNNLATTVRDLGRLAEAETLQRQAYEAYRRTQGPTAPDTIDMAENLAVVIGLRGRYGEQVPLAREVWTARRAAEGPTGTGALRTGMMLYWALENDGRREEAYGLLLSDLFPGVLEQEGTAYTIEPRRTQVIVKIVMATAVAMMRLDRQDTAVELSELMVGFQRGRWGEGNERTLEAMALQVYVLSGVGRTAEAEALAARVARGVTANRPPGEAPLRAEVVAYSNLGVLRGGLGQLKGSYEAWSTAADLNRARYRDRRVSGDSDAARALLVRDTDVFTGQIRAGWDWANGE